jgi:hypothetical protein
MDGAVAAAEEGVQNQKRASLKHAQHLIEEHQQILLMRLICMQ